MKAHKIIDARKMYDQFCTTSVDTVQETVSAMLYSFELQGYSADQIRSIYYQIKSVFDMPAICGKDITCIDVVDHIKEKYGIDFSDFSIKFETFEEFCKHS